MSDQVKCAKCGGTDGKHWIGCPVHIFNVWTKLPPPDKDETCNSPSKSK